AKQARYGPRAGQPNPRFLDARLFEELVLAPYREAKFEPHTGPFLFEFQRHGMAADEFCSRLYQFFLKLPHEFRFAVEVRNPEILVVRSAQIPARHGFAHVYNHWSSMPALAEQHARLQGFTAAFTVLRLLTPLQMSYEAAKKRAEPYTKIVEALPQMRQDTVHLTRQALSAGVRAYVLVN